VPGLRFQSQTGVDRQNQRDCAFFGRPGSDLRYDRLEFLFAVIPGLAMTLCRWMSGAQLATTTVSTRPVGAGFVEQRNIDQRHGVRRRPAAWSRNLFIARAYQRMYDRFETLEILQDRCKQHCRTRAFRSTTPSGCRCPEKPLLSAAQPLPW
jgi:hypothetical protein